MQLSCYKTSSLLLLLHQSIKLATGRGLVDGTNVLKVPSQMWDLKCCIAIMSSGDAHGPSPPRVAYANAAALAALGCTWQDLEPCSPSALAALPSGKANGSGGDKPEVRMLGPVRWTPPQPASVTPLMADTLSCTVHSPSGSVVGQALLFDTWVYEDGRLGRPLVPPCRPADVPTHEQLADAEDELRAQADLVRALKGQRALGNQDPDVQAAVAVLQQLKLRVASLRELLQAYVDSPSWLLAHLGPGISLTSSM